MKNGKIYNFFPQSQPSSLKQEVVQEQKKEVFFTHVSSDLVVTLESCNLGILCTAFRW